MNSGNCSCEPGWAGVSCDSECSEHGKIEDGACVCDYETGWKGPLCDVPGCPGLFGIDCSGRGIVKPTHWLYLVFFLFDGAHKHSNMCPDEKKILKIYLIDMIQINITQ